MARRLYITPVSVKPVVGLWTGWVGSVFSIFQAKCILVICYVDILLASSRIRRTFNDCIKSLSDKSLIIDVSVLW